ncbi:MAG: heparin lyase I family protein [Acidimicrobiales bacterium]
MSDLESRLRSQLTAESAALPGSAVDVGSAVARGRRRQRRALVVSSLGAILALVGTAAALGPALDLFGGRSETVFADQPESGDDDRSARAGDEADQPDGSEGSDGVGDGTDDDADVLEIDPPTTTVEPPAGSTASPTPTTIAAASTTATEDDRAATGPEAPIGRTADAVGRLPIGSVLFHSDNEGCADIENRQAHPDWVEGQPGTGRNEDGTPTYGFAYNTGDSTAGDIAWRFVERSGAPSGRCVVSMTLNHADDSSHAVRLFRRYDRNGDRLPADAYYSVWLYFPDEIVFDNRGTIDGEPAFGFWNVFQVQNDVTQGDERLPLSAFSFLAGKLPGDDAMSLNIFSKAACGAVEECDEARSIDQVDPVAIPTDRWVHFEFRLRSRSDADGRIEVWQDGHRILDFTGQTERPGTARRTFSLNNMGHLHHTPSHTLFADDVLIATAPIHPELFG